MQMMSFFLLTAAVTVPVVLIMWVIGERSIQRILFCTLFALYVSTVFLAVGLPNVRRFDFDPHLYLVPFAGMMTDLRSTLLNIILFIPLGVFLPFLWMRFEKMHSTVCLAFGISLAIELLQMFSYRATDINDLLTNTIGAVLGYCIFRTSGRWKLLKPKPSPKTGELYMIMITVFFVMFFVQPYLEM